MSNTPLILATPRLCSSSSINFKHKLMTSHRAISIKKASVRAINTVITISDFTTAALMSSFSLHGLPWRDVKILIVSFLLNSTGPLRIFALRRPRSYISLRSTSVYSFSSNFANVTALTVPSTRRRTLCNGGVIDSQTPSGSHYSTGCQAWVLYLQSDLIWVERQFMQCNGSF